MALRPYHDGGDADDNGDGGDDDNGDDIQQSPVGWLPSSMAHHPGHHYPYHANGDDGGEGDDKDGGDDCEYDNLQSPVPAPWFAILMIMIKIIMMTVMIISAQSPVIQPGQCHHYHDDDDEDDNDDHEYDDQLSTVGSN